MAPPKYRKIFAKDIDGCFFESSESDTSDGGEASVESQDISGRKKTDNNKRKHTSSSSGSSRGNLEPQPGTSAGAGDDEDTMVS